MVSRSAMRNGLIGVAVSYAILAITAVFFHDADKGVLSAVAMFAFFSAIAVAHALDALERRPKRDR